MKIHSLWLLLPVVWLSSVARSADLEPIPQEDALKIAEGLTKSAAKIEKPQVAVDPDIQKANGFHVPQKLGGMVIPQQGLKEGEELAQKFKTENGAPIGYLFLYKLAPVIENQRADAGRLRGVKIETSDGDHVEVTALLLSVRQLADDDYRLYVYGSEAKPLVDARFSEGSSDGPTPVSVELKDPDSSTREGKLVVTVFGKYQASFRVGHVEE